MFFFHFFTNRTIYIYMHHPLHWRTLAAIERESSSRRFLQTFQLRSASSPCLRIRQDSAVTLVIIWASSDHHKLHCSHCNYRTSMASPYYQCAADLRENGKIPDESLFITIAHHWASPRVVLYRRLLPHH